ncbi:MAG: DUF4276 family protein [Deltaproteobacteria bacterium]|jgi:hypothetical protein|nr:DUF4276 family protein [Deltaproteobacteria bacterium]
MSKPDLIVITEGQTETRALPELLATHLRDYGWEPVFTTFGTTRRQKGGALRFKTLLNDIKASAKQYAGCYISTFFDYHYSEQKT